MCVMATFVLDTFSGRKLNLSEPAADQIAVEDIASALSKICRFGAQAGHFYSVAQHAMLVSDLVIRGGRPELALPALHHDSHEAYLGDIPTPVKRKLRLNDRTSDYKNLEGAIDIAIGLRFGYGWINDRDELAAIKRADLQALLAEAGVLIHDAGEGIRQTLAAEGTDVAALQPLPRIEALLAPEDAEQAFLAAHAAAG